MENSGTLHKSFSEKIHATYKILQEFAFNIQDSYKICM